MGVRYLYVDDGQSFRAVEPDVQPGPGEAIFEHDPATPERLAAVFPNYAARVRASGVKAEIGRLERQQTPRRLRESALGTDGGWLANLETQITALRKTL